MVYNVLNVQCVEWFYDTDDDNQPVSLALPLHIVPSLWWNIKLQKIHVWTVNWTIVLDWDQIVDLDSS